MTGMLRHKTLLLALLLILLGLPTGVFAQGIITTIAGSTWSFSGDGRDAKTVPLGCIGGICLDPATNDGTIYAADGGPATLASLNYPNGISVDASGNLYIADWSNNRIRKVSANGIMSTVAGNGNYGFSGDGGAATSAQLASPQGVVVIPGGGFYF